MLLLYSSFIALLVQDLEHLLRLDATNVGTGVEDKRQRSERLLSKAGNGELRAVRKRAGDGAAVDTVKDAQALREKVTRLDCALCMFGVAIDCRCSLHTL